MSPIFLIGYMCSGKTTLGRALSVYTGLKFIDLDQAIEERVGMTISQIFATHGEKAFRNLEADMLRRLADSKDVIIACGGGTPCRPGAMEIMNAKGLTVRLVPAHDVLIRRLLEGRAHRPLIADIDSPEAMSAFVDHAMSTREAHYAKARHVFDTSLLETPEQIEHTAAQFAQRFITPQ